MLSYRLGRGDMGINLSIRNRGKGLLSVNVPKRESMLYEVLRPGRHPCSHVVGEVVVTKRVEVVDRGIRGQLCNEEWYLVTVKYAAGRSSVSLVE